MRVTEFKLFKFNIPLERRLKLKTGELNNREGLVVRLTDENANNSFGEISPLPGFSEESLDQCQSQLAVFFEKINSVQWPDQFLYPYPEYEDQLSRLYPSVQFGIESALIGLVAKRKNQSFSKYLNEFSSNSVLVNGLLSGDSNEVLKKATVLKNEGYKAVKLKVGAKSITEDVRLVAKVRQVIGEKVSLRLDSNRSWNLNEAGEFSNKVADFNIEYLEEPLSDPSQLVTALNRGEFAVPIALDETLREILPAELHTFDAAEAIVIKPTLIGLLKSLRFIHQAKTQEITPVISSAFESGLGIRILAQLAATVNLEDIPVGLDTFDVFSNDVIKEPLPVTNGLIKVAKLWDPESIVDYSLLNELKLS